jgi:hypothetical protein
LRFGAVHTAHHMTIAREVLVALDGSFASLLALPA